MEPIKEQEQNLVSTNPFDKILDAVESISRFHYRALMSVDLRRASFFQGDTAGYGRVGLDKKRRKFTIELTPKMLEAGLNDQAFVLMHEIEHILRGHLFKPDNVDHVLWNIAGDALINTDLEQEYFGKREMQFDIQKTFVTRENHNIPPEADTVEKVYDFLYDESKKNGGQTGKPMQGGAGKGQGQGQPQSGQNPGTQPGGSPGTLPTGPSGNQIGTANDIIDTENADPSDMDDAHRDLVKDLKEGQSFEFAPARFKNMHKSNSQSKMSWRDIMRAAFNKIKPDPIVTFSKVNVRKWAAGFLAPGRKFQGLPRVFVGIDTSGSCEAAGPYFMQELNQCLEATGLTVDGCFIDTKMYPFENIDKVDEEFMSKSKGGGGTYFSEMYNHILKADPKYDMVIIMTDCYVDAPTEKLSDRTIILDIGAEVDWPYCEVYPVKITADDYK